MMSLLGQLWRRREFTHDSGPAPDTVEPVIEPACPDCLDIRAASGDTVMWCAQHSSHRRAQSLHYEYPRRFGVGSTFFASE